MKRIYVLLVTNADSEADRAKHILEKLGCTVVEVWDALWAIEKIEYRVGTSGAFDAVIIDEFPVKEAEVIALTIKMTFGDIYIGIMSSEVNHRVHNEYADEIIPETFTALDDALKHRFSIGAI